MNVTNRMPTTMAPLAFLAIRTVISMPPAMPSHMVAERITPALPHAYESAAAGRWRSRRGDCTCWHVDGSGDARGAGLGGAPEQVFNKSRTKHEQPPCTSSTPPRTRGDEEAEVCLGRAVGTDAAHRAAVDVGGGDAVLIHAVARGAAACKGGGPQWWRY